MLAHIQKALLFVLLTGWSVIATASDTIKIGMSLPLSGAAVETGIEVYRGSQAYFTHINEQGGIHGRKIYLHAKDDRYEPLPAIKNAIHFIEDLNINILFGFVGTPTVLRMMPILKRYESRQVALMFPFTGAQSIRRAPYEPFVFNLRASYKAEIISMLSHFSHLGMTRVGLFYQSDAYGRSGWEGVESMANLGTIEIVKESTYQRNSPYEESYEVQAKYLKDAQPDVILIVGAYNAAAGFIRDARNIGLDVPIANISFVGTESLLNKLNEEENKSGKSYTHKLVISQVVPDYNHPDNPTAQEYRAIMDQYGTQLASHFSTTNGEKYSYVSFESFLNAKMLVELMNQLPKDFKQEDLVNHLNSGATVDLKIGGAVSFSKNEHQGFEQIYFTTIQNNKLVPLEDWKQLQL
ncbi:ABC transporter substrate-binding protein [Pleionea sp. CnH1-48]|uniref:ABC transporter substrate-binding protein n=1 Tax=Pleionea sp. CnH1-48 TaxID=2954494 RepID=UPI0020985C1F|nr:ABC transporter substrate-binding protein [Pleionea sp. CnH1-48]MCO7227024.1 ABC transporter substrate-binding protein [Pleionea sp. CnH1-48]